MQILEYVYGLSHNIDAGCFAESKGLCFEDCDSQDVALSAVLLMYTWRHPVNMQLVLLLLNPCYQFCVVHVG